MFALIEQKLPGGRFIAPVLLALFVLAAAVVLGGAIVRPFWGILPHSIPVPPRAWAQAAGAIILLAGMGFYAWRVQRTLRDVRKSVELLWADKQITQTILEDMRPIQERIDDVWQRVYRLEHHTDINGLKQLIMDRMLAAERSNQKRLDASLKGLKAAIDERPESEDPLGR